MLTTSARLLRLLGLLQAPREWTGAQLAERLEVSGRTIRNDVARLRELGYPVQAMPGVAGGYRLGPGAVMPPLLLDDEEAVVVTLALHAAAGGSITGIEETSLRALAKLEQALPSRLRHRVAALRAAMVLAPRCDADDQVDPATLGRISTAIRDREGLRFDYRGYQGGSSLRLAEPHRMVHTGRRWYLVAWDADRQAWRTFRAGRISLKALHGPRFTPRPEPDGDVAAFVAAGVTRVRSRHHVTVRLHQPATALIDWLDPSWGTLEPVDDGHCLFRAGYESLDVAGLYLGMLGIDFDVLDPPELADHLQALSARYARAARSVVGGEREDGDAHP